MRTLFFVTAVSIVVGSAQPSAAAETSARVLVNAEMGSRTSLSVSTDVLKFDVVDPTQPATIVVTFSARARTARAAEVLLSVESVDALESSTGIPCPDLSVNFAGVGEGTLA